MRIAHVLKYRYALYITVAVFLTHGCVQLVSSLSRSSQPSEGLSAQLARAEAPAQFSAFGKVYQFAQLRNPVRQAMLRQFEQDPVAAQSLYAETVKTGRDLYYRNCVHCHGDLLDGDGPVSLGQTPSPPDFHGDTGIAALSDAYLFWRISTGGPGLPVGFSPWNSMMPVGQELLQEDEIWKVIVFLVDRVGEIPLDWNRKINPVALTMHNQSQRGKTDLTGMELYRDRCSVCHGDSGAGDGPAAKFLYPAPRDFTIGLFKYKTSDAETQQPMDADLFHSIKFGLTRTAMPAWKSVLGDDQIRELVEVVKHLDFVGTWAPEDAADEEFDDEGYFQGSSISVTSAQGADNRVPFSDESVTRGRHHFEINCTPCHGDEGRGSPSAEKKLRDDWGARIWPRDLTKPWTWRVTNVADSREETIRNIFTRLSVGIPGTPMPEHASGVDEQDRWHIANYVFTLRMTTPTPSDSPLIDSFKVDGPLPASVLDERWADARPTTLILVPNLIKEGRLYKPLNDSMTIRVLHNQSEIAFLLEMDDRTHSRPGDPDAETIRDPALELFPDAFAIQIPMKGSFTLGATAQLPLFRHGESARPTIIWYWRTESIDPKVAALTMVFEGTGVDQRLTPRIDDHSVIASGRWVNGRWRVLMKRSRQAKNSSDLDFSEEAPIPVSFASWDGSNGESGSKHMLSSWYWVSLSETEGTGPGMGAAGITAQRE